MTTSRQNHHDIITFIKNKIYVDIGHIFKLSLRVDILKEINNSIANHMHPINMINSIRMQAKDETT